MTKAMTDYKGKQSIKDSVPQIVSGGDVKINGVLDCTGRYREDLGGWPQSQRIHRRILTSPVGESIVSFRSKKEFIKAIISVIEGALLCS